MMPHGKLSKVPTHLAIIMDGNGRWAKARMLQRIIGHQRGVETVKKVVEECSNLGIKYLTLFAFSAENWFRPKTEVKALMLLLKHYIIAETRRMVDDNIRFQIIGNRPELPVDVLHHLDEASRLTEKNDGMTLTLALSYGARQEIAAAARRIALDVASGKVIPAEINEEVFSRYLDTVAMPDPDFLIRTSGEMRISNFMLWQLAYTELYFTEKNWPDFDRDELIKALVHYQSRERRFGKTSDQVKGRV
jgi:undecaprenyl diphosphate synthase